MLPFAKHTQAQLSKYRGSARDTHTTAAITVRPLLRPTATHNLRRSTCSPWLRPTDLTRSLHQKPKRQRLNQKYLPAQFSLHPAMNHIRKAPTRHSPLSLPRGHLYLPPQSLHNKRYISFIKKNRPLQSSSSSSAGLVSFFPRRLSELRPLFPPQMAPPTSLKHRMLELWTPCDTWRNMSTRNLPP